MTEHRCSYCKQMFTSDFFYRSKRSTGVSAGCISCSRKRSSEWNKKNRNRIKARAKTPSQLENEISIAKIWREKNRKKLNEYMSEWRKKSPHISKDKVRSVGTNLTPSWANTFFIKEAYRLARLRTRMTGSKWNVDHIVPLKSRIVCGLHVEDNIRVIPARENQVKGNRYWPNMPEAL